MGLDRLAQCGHYWVMPVTETKSVPLRVNVTPSLAATLQRIAASRDVSVAQVLRHALRDYALRESERKGW